MHYLTLEHRQPKKDEHRRSHGQERASHFIILTTLHKAASATTAEVFFFEYTDTKAVKAMTISSFTSSFYEERNRHFRHVACVSLLRHWSLSQPPDDTRQISADSGGVGPWAEPFWDSF